MATYYDLVLTALPLVVITGTLALSATGVVLQTALLASLAGAATLVGHALFIRGPTEDSAAVAPTHPVDGESQSL
jgi:hypothetical protein